MIGLVVWSSKPRHKAVIWCEDQGALAYLGGRENVISSMEWPEPGDMVELDCETVGQLRFARNVRSVSVGACPELPEALLGSSQRRTTTTTANLVSLADIRRPQHERDDAPLVANF